MKILLFNNKYFASSLLVLFSFILYFLPFFIPIFFIIFPFFSIIPLFYVVTKYKFKTYAPSVLYLMLISIFFFKLAAVHIIINLLIPALLFKMIFKNYKLTSFNRTYYTFLTYSLTITILAVILLQTNYFNKIFQEILKTTNNYFDASMKVLQKQNTPTSDLMKLEKMKFFFLHLLRNYYPTFIFYSLSVFFTINFIFGIFFISKYIVKKPIFINVFYIKTPEHYIWIFLFACLFVFISFYYKNPLFKIITLNLAMISTFIYIIEGGLIFLYRFFILKLNLIFKLIILFLLFQLSFYYIKYASIIFAGLGILDYWFDFRNTSHFKDNNIDTLV